MYCSGEVSDGVAMVVGVVAPSDGGTDTELVGLGWVITPFRGGSKRIAPAANAPASPITMITSTRPAHSTARLRLAPTDVGPGIHMRSRTTQPCRWRACRASTKASRWRSTGAGVDASSSNHAEITR